MVIPGVYILYFLISIWLTFRVGNSLHKHGRPWIINLLHDVNLSDRLNDTLLLAYRLINIGYVLFTLMSGNLTADLIQIVEFISVKFGMIITLLAYLHYQNIIVLLLFSKLKSKYKWQI